MTFNNLILLPPYFQYLYKNLLKHYLPYFNFEAIYIDQNLIIRAIDLIIKVYKTFEKNILFNNIY
jgi:hypothetical protein